MSMNRLFLFCLLTISSSFAALEDVIPFYIEELVPVEIPFEKNPELTDEQYWEKTDIDMNNYLAIFDDNSCYLSSSLMRACLASINTYLASMKSKLSLMPSKFMKYSKLEKHYGPLTLAEHITNNSDVSKLSQREYFDFTQNRKKEYLDYIEANVLNNAIYPKVNFREVIADIQKKYLDESKIKIHTARFFNTYLKLAVDSHTSISPTQQLMDGRNSQGLEYAGIGAYLGIYQKKLLITEVFEDSPSEKAGLKAGDLIVEIDGAPIVIDEQYGISESVKLIKGLQGTKVKLTIERQGEKNQVIEVIRDFVVVKNIRAKKNRNSLVIKIDSFSQNDTCKMFYNELNKANQLNLKSIIIDLRNNPGGLLNQSICMASLLAGPGKNVVTTKSVEGNNPSLESYETSFKKIFNSHVVVLINEGSASASEVLSGFLKEKTDAIIVGNRSFGKGTVLGASQLSKSITIYSTYAYFYIANKWTPHRVGITPDIEVYNKPDPTEDEKFFWREAEMYETSVKHIGPLYLPSAARTRRNAEIKRCIHDSGKALAHYNKTKDAIIKVDYQLETALDVAACMLTFPKHR